MTRRRVQLFGFRGSPEAENEGYTGGMKKVRWHPEEPAAPQLRAWSMLAREPGVLVASFDGTGGDSKLEWKELVRWTRSRAVTVADVRSDLSAAALDVALCSDLVVLRRGIELAFPIGEPSAGMLWALGRAGRAALARGLLDLRTIAAEEAVRLGLAQRVHEPGDVLAISENASNAALSAARDLMRSSPHARPALELAVFRLLFASGHPREGARAFFERRSPDFTD